MNSNSLRLLVLGMLFAPIAATAQQVTLDYAGSIMSGTSYAPGTPTVASPTAGDLFTGVITARDTTNGWNILSYEFDLNGSPSPMQVPGGLFVNLTLANGAVTGAIAVANWSGDGGSYAFAENYSIGGPSGDSYQSTASGGPLQNCLPYCGVIEGSSISGTWHVVTQAPEIDPTSAASGATLLLGGLAVLRGRRKKTIANCWSG